MVFATYFRPRNINFIKNFSLRLRLKKRARRLSARSRHINSYLLRAHTNSKLNSLIGNARRILYGRHIFLCYTIANLFYLTNNYVFGQGLISKTLGFQNLRLFFAHRQLSSFLLAKKDINYLMSYGQIFPSLAVLVKGGYNFFVYTSNLQPPLTNFFKIFTATSAQLIDGTIKFVRFFSIFFRIAGQFMYNDFFIQKLNSPSQLYESKGVISGLETFATNLKAFAHFAHNLYGIWNTTAVVQFLSLQLNNKFLAFLHGFRGSLPTLSSA